MNMRYFTLSALVLVFGLTNLSTAQEMPGAEAYGVHAINGSDLGLDVALPVDIAIDGNCALPNVTFQDISEPLPVPPGISRTEVRLADAAMPCGGALVLASDVPLALFDNAAVVAHLTAEGAITATKFNNDLRAIAPNQTRVVFRHTADAPAVDVVAQTDGGTETILFSNVANGAQAVTMVPSGTYQVAVRPAGSDATVLGPLSVTLQPQTVAVIYAVGSATTDPASLDALVQELMPTP